MANLFAIGGWLILIFAGRRRWAAPLVSGALIPLLLAVLYSGLLIVHRRGSEGGFGSLAEVSAPFLQTMGRGTLWNR